MLGIVTPSYNQGQFLEQTIDSVLSQGYPNLQYVIIDGGSTDNSVEIIRKYEKHLTFGFLRRTAGSRTPSIRDSLGSTSMSGPISTATTST